MNMETHNKLIKLLTAINMFLVSVEWYRKTRVVFKNKASRKKHRGLIRVYWKIKNQNIVKTIGDSLCLKPDVKHKSSGVVVDSCGELVLPKTNSFMKEKTNSNGHIDIKINKIVGNKIGLDELEKRLKSFRKRGN